ncbi:MAG: hypothetical protein ACYC5M_07540 [Anaerolineae bacterium]
MFSKVTKIGIIIALFAILLLAWPQAGCPTATDRGGSTLLQGFPFFFLQAHAQSTAPAMPPSFFVAPGNGEPEPLHTAGLLGDPAPYLRVETWLENGQPAAGGNIAIFVHFMNQGDAPAENVVITNTLQGMSFITATLDIPPSGAGAQHAWSLGSLQPGDETSFYLFAHVSAAQGHWITSSLDIATSSPGDQGDPSEKHAEWSGEVLANDTSLNLGISPWTGDPAAGQDVVFHINLCNNGATGSTQVILTDTLPLSMTIQDWWSDLPGWTELSRNDHQLVLSFPSANGWSCSGIYVRAQVDPAAWPGMEVWNEVEVSADSDLDPEDNQARWDGQVNSPRTDLGIGKGWSAGQLVPGGEITYWVFVNNHGNMPVGPFFITDTLPVSTTFQSAWLHDANSSQPFAPILDADGVVVWEFPGLENGYWNALLVTLDVNADATPGTSLVNAAEVTCFADEDSCADNMATWSEMLYPHGPNVRVRKQHEWHGDGRLNYAIQVENVGDEQVTGIVVTDTYPLDTTFHGEWWEETKRSFDLAFEHLDGDRQLQWTIEYLDPGVVWAARFNAALDYPSQPLRWYTNTIDVSVPVGDTNPDDNTFEDIAFSGGEVQWVEIEVNRSHVWGCAYSAPVTLTTASGEATMDDACWDAYDAFDALGPGDTITITGGAGLQPVVVDIPDPFVAHASSIIDTVWGQIGALDHEPVHIGLSDSPPKWVTTDDSGRFSATYPDVAYGAQGDISYRAEIDYAQVGLIQHFRTPDLVLAVNYDHDWVESNYDAGHTIWVTVTNSTGDVKATAEMTSGVIPWWPSDQTGFTTSLDNPWWPQQPDIQPGDWVYGATSSGYTATVRVGEITGYLDVESDSITGTVEAPWIMPGPVPIECHPWGAPHDAPSKQDSVIPDGVDTYTCAWDPAEEWDLRAGQDVGVSYSEPDGHRVFGVFRGPAPHLRVETWLEGGQPGVGGNVLLRVQYVNAGDSPAEDVVITSTLEGLAYLSDTHAPASSGDDAQRVWALGTLEPGDWTFFYLYAEVTAGQGQWITNTLDIATSNPDDQGDSSEKRVAWSGEVLDNDTHLTADLSAWTGDPAAGQDVVFHINVCNKGGTGSTPVTLTETLPISMTVQDWWSDLPGWVEVSQSAHELVLTVPTVNGWTCSGVYVRARVAAGAEPGLELWNEVVLTATNDLDPDDNQVRWDGQVYLPYTDLGINQNWSWGTLVPGGQMHYDIFANNQGNLPIVGPIRITDTLPAGTSLQEWASWGESTVELIGAAGGQVVWEIDGLANGYQVGIAMALDIALDSVPGTMLTNHVEIDVQPGEVDVANNQSAWEETLYPSGPNLRVRKEADWHGYGEGHDAWYRTILENVGDQTVDDVVITDHYPEGMVLDGGPDVGYWNWWDWADQPAAGFFTVTLESLEPGSNVQVNYNMHIPGNDPVSWGLVFTNTASVSPTAGDTNPEDNSATAVLGTGPDLYVVKTLVGGLPQPGELVTYTLRFGNDQPGHAWWWETQGQAVLTDTLPAGMSYVTSTQRFCGPEVPQGCACTPDEIDGQTLVWQLDRMGAGHWNQILLTARIDPTASITAALVNQAVIGTDQAHLDIEPFTENNASSATLAALPDLAITKTVTPELELNLGDVVTYTIELANNGGASATGIVLTDTLPTGVDFGAFVTNEDGAQEDDGVIGWSGGLDAGETVTIAFTATLSQDWSLYGATIDNVVEYSSANAGTGDDEASFAVRAVRRVFLPCVLSRQS